MRLFCEAATKRGCGIILFLALSVFFYNPVAEAQGADTDSGPGFFPGVAAGYAWDDNIRRAEENEVDDQFFRIVPSLLHKALFGKHSFDFIYIGEFARYQKEETEDYNDNYFNGDLELDLTQRLDLNLEAGYTWSHERRDVAGSRGIVPLKLDTWEQGKAFAEFVYGRRTNKAQAALSGKFQNRRYTNNDQEDRNRDTGTLNATFFWNLGPKTSILGEFTYENIDYMEKIIVNLDSTSVFYLVGLRWEATAKTTGEFKVGYHVKDMADSDLEDFKGASVWARILWEPKPHSHVSLTASRRTEESPFYTSEQSIAHYYVSNRGEIVWRHSLTQRLDFNADVFFEKIDYGVVDQEDDHFNVTVGIEYSFLRWLKAGVSYSSLTRNSNVEGLDYKAGVIMINIIATKL